MVSKSVILEFEWFMRGYYRFSQSDVATVFQHLLELEHVYVEDRETVERALSTCEAGIDFADGLHHASYRECEAVATFDDKRFARRARRLNMAPVVQVLS